MIGYHPAMPNPAKIVEIPDEDLAPLALPVHVIKLEGTPPMFIFTMSDAARAALEERRFQSLAQALGDMVHPSPATLVVLPDGEKLSAYRVEAAQDDRAVKLLNEAMGWRDGYMTSTPEGQDFVARAHALLKEHGLWSEGQ